MIFRLWMKTMMFLIMGLALVQGDQIKGPVVYVIPIRDEIETTMEYLVRRGVKEAMEVNATALILHMETNGGRVDSTERIIKSLENFQPRDRTYTLIDKKAISAGAFISSATRHIYMTPGSVIGAAAPVMAIPGQGPQVMPESYEEKITSAVRAMVRSSAESHGHRPEVFDAMVDRNQGLKIDGRVLVPEGKLLTLTTKEAEVKLNGKPLLSLGTIPDLNALISNVGGSDARVMTLEPTGFEKVARFITLISPFLLMAGVALGYLEFKTPGFGFFGFLAGLCFVVYFFGHMVAGLSGYEPLLIFLTGVILIVLEVVLFPGLLLPTIIGVALILFAFAFSRVDFYPGTEVLPSWSQFQSPLTQTLYSLLGGFAVMALLARWIPNAWLTRGLEEATVQGSSVKIRGGIQVGDSGISSTILRPSGVGVFGGRSYDVISRGLMIEKGVNIRVVEVSGFRIVVEEETEGERS